MNRREFTASIAALVVSPAVPLSAVPAAPVAASTNTSMAYMFADLIARARGGVDAGFLARRLRLTSDAANDIMMDLAANNVIGRSGIGGFAKAIKPFEFDVSVQQNTLAVSDRIKKTLQDLLDEPEEVEANVENHDAALKIDES